LIFNHPSGTLCPLLEAISKKGFLFKIAAGPSFHAKPDDASILTFKGAP
jgi:hypothetical protein